MTLPYSPTDAAPKCFEKLLPLFGIVMMFLKTGFVQAWMALWIVCGYYFGTIVFFALFPQLLLDEMEQWDERQQLLAAKLDEIRKKPGNLLTG